MASRFSEKFKSSVNVLNETDVVLLLVFSLSISFAVLYQLFLCRFLSHDDDDVSQNVSGFGYTYLTVLKQVI